MADNDFSWDVIVRFATQGAKGSADDLQRVGTAVEKLNKEGKLTERQYESVSRGLAKAGAAADTAKGSSDRFNSSLIQQRYALYDVASTYGVYASAVAAAGTATVVAFASQERAFTNVERTADGALGNIQQSLVELSNTIPFSFNQLAEIATLGNQLGVPAADIEAFTETIATFSTVTGISVDASAQAFGKLGNLLGVGAQDYDRLASSITLVGRTTAATESQIISVAAEIAPAAAAAGFAADEVIGLSGALSSLRVPPERSRSTILQFFEVLNNAVANGGQDLENFATVVGVTSAELENMVRSGQGKDIFSRFISSTANADTVELTQALQELGLAGLRTNPTIRALAGNTQLLSDAFSDGRQGYTENTELQRQMALILDDLATRFQLVVNAVVNFAAAVGGTLAPVIGPILDTLKTVIVALTEFVNTDQGAAITRVAALLAGITVAYAAYRTAIALTTASTYALITAQRGLAASGATTSIGQLILGMRTLTGATTTATTATGVLRGALSALGRTLVILGALQVASELIFNFGGSMRAIQPIVNGLTDAVVNLLRVTLTVSRGIGSALSGLPGELGGTFQRANKILEFTQNNLDAIGTVAKKNFGEWVDSVQPAEEASYAAGDALSAMGEAAGTTGAAGDLGDLGNAAGGATAEVRTLTDYANDLASVWDRAFEIRFSGQQTLDTITTSLDSIRDAAEEARRNMASLQAEISGIQNDISAQQYFLGIAIEYKDSARAEAIQANLAKLQANLADKTADLNDAQSANSKELTGNSKAAINNRKTITDLVAQYQAHIRSLASSGLSSDELARRTEELRQDFVTQATQLGYNRGELALYEQSFYDVATAINAVPRNITVAANVDPALQALAEFRAKGVEAGQAVGNALSNAFGGGAGGFSTAAAEDAAKKIARRALLLAEISVLQAQALTYGLQGNVFQAVAAQTAIAVRNAILASGGYASGGFTGRGGKYEPAGVVHRGEYVVPKEQVNQRTGLPYANALGQLQKGVAGRSGYAGGGFVRGGGTFDGVIRQFGPMAAQQLMMALTTQMTMDGSVVGKAVNRSNENSTALGSW